LTPAQSKLPPLSLGKAWPYTSDAFGVKLAAEDAKPAVHIYWLDGAFSLVSSVV
jgi:hypothetical protein